ncbi:MAG: hypothetical protein QM520_04890, partial [Gammaproteobacteria bacterium]|nr:hypothetical protein [Gammaproteobacteria bacterium]
KPFIIESLFSQRQPLDALMIIWILVTLVFFSIPNSKLIGYILPVLAPLAYCLARVIMTQHAKHPTPQLAGLNFMGHLVVGMALCLSLWGYKFFDQSSGLEKIAPFISSNTSVRTQTVALDSYPFDMKFMLQLTNPIWVVLDWDNPDIQKKDNWRKELSDAKKFSQKIEVLINPENLKHRICQTKADQWLFWAPHQQAVFSLPPQAKVLLTTPKYQLWQVEDAVLRTDCELS